MADAAASVVALHSHSMPLLAHLEELRKRIIFSVLGILAGFLSCWSFADRIFGLMTQSGLNNVSSSMVALLCICFVLLEGQPEPTCVKGCPQPVINGMAPDTMRSTFPRH
jgi:hypothetical protein